MRAWTATTRSMSIVRRIRLTSSRRARERVTPTCSGCLDTIAETTCSDLRTAETGEGTASKTVWPSDTSVSLTWLAIFASPLPLGSGGRYAIRRTFTATSDPPRPERPRHWRPSSAGHREGLDRGRDYARPDPPTRRYRPPPAFWSPGRCRGRASTVRSHV